MQDFPLELEDAYLCEVLGLTEKELYESSKEHIIHRFLVKSAHNKADNERAKQKPRS